MVQGNPSKRIERRLQFLGFLFDFIGRLVQFIGEGVNGCSSGFLNGLHSFLHGRLIGGGLLGPAFPAGSQRQKYSGKKAKDNGVNKFFHVD